MENLSEPLKPKIRQLKIRSRPERNNYLLTNTNSACNGLSTTQIQYKSLCIGWVSSYEQKRVSSSERPRAWLLLAPSDVPFPEESMKTATLLDNIEEPTLKTLIDRLLVDRAFLSSLLTAPASLRHHHAYPGGLIRHTRETMSIVLANSGGLKPIERDILLSAAFLHDLGKAYEYCKNRLTDRGDLLGHEVTLLEVLAPIMNSIWHINDPIRLALLHFLIAKPAPQWTGIRHPRTRLVNILRFADKSSGEADLENTKYSSNRFQTMLQRNLSINTRSERMPRSRTCG